MLYTIRECRVLYYIMHSVLKEYYILRECYVLERKQFKY
jgi:hypothetical protein